MRRRRISRYFELKAFEVWSILMIKDSKRLVFEYFTLPDFSRHLNSLEYAFNASHYHLNRFSVSQETIAK